MYVSFIVSTCCHAWHEDVLFPLVEQAHPLWENRARVQTVLWVFRTATSWWGYIECRGPAWGQSEHICLTSATLMKTSLNLWTQPIHLENLSQEIVGNDISALLFPVKSEPWTRDSEAALHLDAVNTDIPGSSVLRMTPAIWGLAQRLRLWTAVTDSRSHLDSKKWIVVLVVDSDICYHEIWTLSLPYSKACGWHL